MKLGVCVPYKNREEHLKEFIPKVGEYLTKQGIEHEFFIAHQSATCVLVEMSTT